MTTRPKDSELQQARLAQIQDDIDEVQENQQHGSKRPLSQPTTSIGFPPSKSPLVTSMISLNWSRRSLEGIDSFV